MQMHTRRMHAGKLYSISLPTLQIEHGGNREDHRNTTGMPDQAVALKEGQAIKRVGAKTRVSVLMAFAVPANLQCLPATH